MLRGDYNGRVRVIICEDAELENTSKETTEEPILLSWELGAGKRRLYRIIAYTALVLQPLGILALFLIHGWWWNILVFFLWFIGLPALMLAPFGRAAVRLSVTASGIRACLAFGNADSTRWTGVQSLKSGLYGFAVLRSDAFFVPVYLPIPPDIRARLIAILRETSNARIVGFGPEGS